MLSFGVYGPRNQFGCVLGGIQRQGLWDNEEGVGVLLDDHLIPCIDGGGVIVEVDRQRGLRGLTPGHEGVALSILLTTQSESCRAWTISSSMYSFAPRSTIVDAP